MGGRAPTGLEGLPTLTPNGVLCDAATGLCARSVRSPHDRRPGAQKNEAAQKNEVAIGAAAGRGTDGGDRHDARGLRWHRR
ncbi:hypothetical protein GCM10010464_36660 [Pseudonocardia yunnanensis]